MKESENFEEEAYFDIKADEYNSEEGDEERTKARRPMMIIR